MMSAARLDPFSARLHAIHRKGAKAAAKPAPPRPASPLLPDEGSAPEGATTGMPVREDEVRRLLGDDDDDGRVIVTNDEDDQWSWRRGHDGLHARVDDDMPSYAGMTNPRNVHEGDGDATHPVHRHEVDRGRGHDAEDAQDRLRELMRRMSALEREMSELKGELVQQGALRPRTPGGSYIEGDPFQHLSHD